MTMLLIITGPQGSGNHVFSKIFAEHPAVNGWAALKDTYWAGHDQEPFADMWRNPELVSAYPWHTSKYHVTSISCPYKDNGEDAWPQYQQFIDAVHAVGVDVKLAIIGRDQNILAYQEQRLRDRVTYTEFLDRLPALMQYNPVFLSQELAYLYKEVYIKQVSAMLDFPIQYNAEILTNDANAKYMQPVINNWLDPLIKQASSKHTNDK